MFNWLAFSFKREAIHSNFIVWFTRPMFEPTIYYTQSEHAYYYTTDARTHDLLHSKSARLLLHHRCLNPRSTTLKVSTLTITPSMLEPTIYYTQSQHAYYYTTDARTHDLLHSKSARLLLHHRCGIQQCALIFLKFVSCLALVWKQVFI